MDKGSYRAISQSGDRLLGLFDPNRNGLVGGCPESWSLSGSEAVLDLLLICGLGASGSADRRRRWSISSKLLGFLREHRECITESSGGVKMQRLYLLVDVLLVLRKFNSEVVDLSEHDPTQRSDSDKGQKDNEKAGRDPAHTPALQ